ncbi:MAG TPA: nuclear transport factor 2 family protein [Rhizobiaceae bacterium]|nr:nuclear transport factor 2 family protein [Rhizobiaceae bacterium]
MSPREIAIAAVTAIFIDFSPEAATTLLNTDYIQHNPGVPTGAAPIIGFIPGLQQSGIKVTTHRTIAEGDFVVFHNTYENAHAFGAPTLVGFDVFRVADGKVAEHWDNLQAPGEPNASGRTLTDGPTEVTDLDKTAQNKALVEAFAEAVLVGGDGARIAEFISTTTYHQHNPMIGDGLDSLGQAFAALAASGNGISYSKVHKIVAEGNFVFLMAEGKMGETPTAFFDLFRVENGKIVEHWDVISSIPAEMAHSNGKF